MTLVLATYRKYGDMHSEGMQAYCMGSTCLENRFALVWLGTIVGLQHELRCTSNRQLLLMQCWMQRQCRLHQ
jgi:hypothetical protein